MKSLKRLFSAAPEGTAALFFIQIFSTLGFAVLYSTLVLYATKHLQLPVKVATTLMGVFGAFNYGLHLFGGYLGGRFLSNRNLFVGGMALQVIGCGCIAGGSYYISRSLWSIVLKTFANHELAHASAGTDSLTDRELQVFTLTGRGAGAMEMAQNLGVSVKTVETHQMRIKQKLNLSSAVELRKYAMRRMSDWRA